MASLRGVLRGRASKVVAGRAREPEENPLNEPLMPTTVPSPVDRGEFAFVAVDATGVEWRWIDAEMVWVRVAGGTKPPGEIGADGCRVLH